MEGSKVDPSTVPDLVGTVHTFSSDWLIKKMVNLLQLQPFHFKDNQQIGRQNADQAVTVNGGRVGIALNSRLNLNVDLVTSDPLIATMEE